MGMYTDHDLETVLNGTQDAYSIDRYKSWRKVAEYLLRSGWSVDQSIAIMNSKYTRWAADIHGAAYGRVPVKALANYLTTDTPEEEQKLVREVNSFID